MKFEKHLKSTGIKAVIYKARNGNLFLRNGVFGNVLMRIPEGCAPIGNTITRDLDLWLNDLVINGRDCADAQLESARLMADGAPKDIQRIYRNVIRTGEFSGKYGDKICIINQDAYSLIEQYDDIRIFKPFDEYFGENTEPPIPALVILDKREETIGIILNG